jgi:hypothetical protein
MPRSPASQPNDRNKQTPSPDEWLNIWLGKCSKELIKRELTEKESQFHCAIIRRYLSEHPGNPRAIDIEKLRRFVNKQKNDVRQPLILFYTNVALSEKHVQALNSIRPKKIPPSHGKPKRPIRQTR